MVHRIGVHACPDCPKTFSRLEYVARHRRLRHLGIRPWCCECGSSYARSDLLTRHKRKCEGKRSNTHVNKVRDLKLPVSSQDYQQSATRNISPVLSYELLQDDQEPPSYQQATMYQEPTTTSITLALPSESQACLAPTPGNLPSRSFILSAERQGPIEGDTVHSKINENEQFDFSQDIHGQTEIETDSTVFNQDEIGCDEQICTKGPIESTTKNSSSSYLGDPFDSVIPYIQPHFFISDVPESSPFYLNPNLWVLAFLCQRSQGFTIPHLGILSRFLSRATQVILPVIPMIHVPTFKAALTTIHLGYALSVAGAASENSPHAIAYTDQSLTYKRPLVQNDFLSRKNGFNFRFELFQALLVYQFVGMFSHLEVQKIRSRKFSQTIIENFRDLGFIERLRKTPDYIHLALSGEVPLDLAWKLWVNYEVQKRTAFLVLISSIQLKGSTQNELKLAEADLPLPCHEDLWMAKSAIEWAEAAQNHSMECLIIDNNKQKNNILSNRNLKFHHDERNIGKESIPLLSEALANLNLSDQNQYQYPSNRLGCFAKTVIHHTRSLASQATVRSAIF